MCTTMAEKLAWMQVLLQQQGPSATWSLTENGKPKGGMEEILTSRGGSGGGGGGRESAGGGGCGSARGDGVGVARRAKDTAQEAVDRVLLSLP